MGAGHYRFRLGRYDCVSLYDGFHDYPLERMVCNAPRSDVEATLQHYGFATDLIRTPFTFLYVNTGDHQILVDGGAGDLLPTTGQLIDTMRDAGITPDTIDAVFITHAHGDHINGLVDEHGQPTFIQAHYYICRAEWDFWFSEDALVQANSGLVEVARYVLTAIKDKTIFLEQEEEVLPGVTVLLAPGHTPGHMVVSFASEGEQLLYIGDVALHPIHLEHPDWLPVLDILPEAAAISKRRIFDLAASNACWVIAQQFPPFPSLGHVITTSTGWKWQPVGNERRL